jgi:predicted ATPase/class 3 adenylate cyclase
VSVVEFPSGTVTFLFTDLQGSTRLWEEFPEAMGAALARHDEILRDAVEGHHGSVVKTTGDGVHAVFATARDAVDAAGAAQRALTAESWGQTGRLRVRMGLHTCEAEYRDGDYYGSEVNRAARLMSVAHGGQVVVSWATAGLVRDGSVELIDLGEHRLRDLTNAERIFQVHAPGLGREFPRLRSLDVLPGNLPLQMSSFVGRDREIARVVAALSEARVVTLTGVGGVGKTRLAVQVAAEIMPGFSHGAWLVELAPVRNAEGVVDAVAKVFDVTARSGLSLDKALVEFLRHKELLLVLDNCEHVLDEAAELMELLVQSCPRVEILATSREGVGIDAERLLAVPSLGSPAPDASIPAIADADAVRLFVERARGFGAELEITDDNAESIAQVCRRLDGVPLAIELAAARVPAMNPRDLAGRLDRRFQLLAGGRRGKIERHQTLRAVIDWSFDLLSEPEQRLLARVAVFSGGWTLDAAEEVGAGGPVNADEVFELIERLVARSLVVAEDRGFQTRYRLLETIREYGEERLAEQGETDEYRSRHAEFYCRFSEQMSATIVGPQQIEIGRRFGAEHENVLAAINFAIDADDADLALRLVWAVPFPLEQVGVELRPPAEAAARLTGAAEHLLVPRCLALAAFQSAQHGDGSQSQRLLEEALAAAERLGDPDGYVETNAAGVQVFVALGAGAPRDAAVQAEEAADKARVRGRFGGVAVFLASAATYRAMAGDTDHAQVLATEGLTQARKVEAPTLIALNLVALAAALAEDDPAHANTLLRESITLCSSLGVESAPLANQAVLVSARIGDWRQTLALAAEAIPGLHWTGDRPLLAAVLNLVARGIASGQPETAALLQGAARNLLVPSGHRISAVPNNQPTPQTQATQTTPETDFVTTTRRTTTGQLVEQLGDTRLHELRAQGEAMSDDQAVTLALDAIDRALHQNSNGHDGH